MYYLRQQIVHIERGKNRQSSRVDIFFYIFVQNELSFFQIPQQTK